MNNPVIHGKAVPGIVVSIADYDEIISQYIARGFIINMIGCAYEAPSKTKPIGKMPWVVMLDPTGPASLWFVVKAKA